MPSLHVGWALLVGIVVVMASTSRWRWIVLAHPVLTITVVVVTANHWWLDGVVAAMLLAMSYGLDRWVRRRRTERRPDPVAPTRAHAPTARSDTTRTGPRRPTPSVPVEAGVGR